MSAGLSTRGAFIDALNRAGSIAFGAYSLAAGGLVARALERAAGRGADVSVVLEGCPYDGGGPSGLARANQRTAAELQAHGVRVRLAGATGERVHIKAAVVDGTAFLDDRNWPGEGCDTILATSVPADVAAIAAALRGRSAASGAVATEKAAALRLEAGAIARAAGDRIDVETESFGGCAVSKALRDRVAGGARVRLVLSATDWAGATPRERTEVAELAREGVAVRLGRSNEKLCVAGDRGWVGSANASFSPEPMLDWGLATTDRSILSGLAATFERDWERSAPLRLGAFSVASQDGCRRSR